MPTIGNWRSEVDNGWLAALQHHFVSRDRAAGRYAEPHYQLQSAGQSVPALGAGPADRPLPPARRATFHETLFVGPKLQAQLDRGRPRLELVADYGKLTILARPLFWLLGKVHALVGNWGVAIIIVTFLLKLLFYPLSEASGRSMAKMKALAPRIKQLQETYKDDARNSTAP